MAVLNEPWPRFRINGGCLSVCAAEYWRDHDSAVLVECDQSIVEGCVERRCQQQPVVTELLARRWSSLAMVSGERHAEGGYRMCWPP
jgi:hypothetical protein